MYENNTHWFNCACDAIFGVCVGRSGKLDWRIKMGANGYLPNKTQLSISIQRPTFLEDFPKKDIVSFFGNS